MLFRSLKTDSTRYGVNMVLDPLQGTAITGYDASAFGFLINQTTVEIKKNDRLFMSWYDPGGVVYSIRLSSSTTQIIANTVVANNYLYNQNVGYDILSNTLKSEILTNGYYKVGLYDFGDNLLGSEIRVNVDTCTQLYTNYRLHWLNQYGGWESINFNKVSTQKSEINRNIYKIPTPIGYTINDRLKRQFQTTITDKVAINTDWLTDTQLDWIRGLFESPIVFYEQGSNMIPVQLTNASYDTQYYTNGRKLHNVTAEMEYSYNRYRQEQ